MNDFVIQFGRGGDVTADAQRLALMLRNRPVVFAHPVQTFEFPWGRVAIQPPRARGYAPVYDAQTKTLVACVGRPRFMGVEHESGGEQAFNALVRTRLAGGESAGAGARALSDSLTGMFAVIECTAAGVRVFTDPMSFLPVYVGRDSSGRVASIGTHLDAVADLAGRLADFDAASLGDLLVNQYVTFPYTTRRGVTQLEPASMVEFVNGAPPRTTTYWRPLEPAANEAPSARELEEELESSLRFASQDVARGARRIALTLSGGLDSRLVLASLMGSDLAGAITYATRPNRELEVAQRVAAAAGVPHHVAWRGEEFYAQLMPRAVALLGTELRGECHGFCIVDNGLDQSFDLIVGGFLSDTLFKGHYLSEADRERFRRRSPYYRARQAIASAARTAGLLPPVTTKPHYWDVARAMGARLKADVREEVEQRRRVRLDQVRQVRPQSAGEWVRFWPGSRCDGGYGPQANSRLFTADELFMHRRLIEVAARVPQHEKVGGRLTRRVFPRLYGELGQIEDSTTGVPAAASSVRRARRNGHSNGNGHANEKPDPTASRYPWNDVDHSWVDYVLLQKLSPTWAAYRTALADSPALDVLDDVLEGGAGEFVAAYRDEAGFLFNRAAVQIIWGIDRVLRPDAPPAPTPPQMPQAGSPATGSATASASRQPRAVGAATP